MAYPASTIKLIELFARVAQAIQVVVEHYNGKGYLLPEELTEFNKLADRVADLSKDLGYSYLLPSQEKMLKPPITRYQVDILTEDRGKRVFVIRNSCMQIWLDDMKAMLTVLKTAMDNQKEE